MQYQNLNHALKLFKVQVLEGIPYAQKNVPEFKSAQDIFDWLKLRTKYKNDPQGTELFQTLPTLLENNFHGITGHGDCDCFTIAALTVLAANNFKNFGIVLVGRNAFNPVHIYCYVIDETGEKKYLDLTNKYFNQTRNYLYKQEIPFNLTLKEKNDMLLQLADMGAPRRMRKPTPQQIAKYKNSAVYQRRRAAFLKRQQENQAHAQLVRQGRRMRPNPNHIYLPSKNIQIREDYFDNSMSNGEFQHMLLSENYSLEEIEELAGRRGDRRRAKKDEKRQLKKEKKQSKIELRKARAEKKRAAGEAKKTRAQAKQDKANRRSGGGDGEDESEAESTAGRIFGKVIGGAKQVVGVYKSARGGGDDSGGDDSGEESTGGGNTGAGSPPTRRNANDESAPKMITIFGKEIKQSTAIIAGVVTAAAVVGTVIAVKQSRKRQAA